MQLAHRPTFRTNQKPHGPEFESPNPALSTCMALGKSSHPRVSVFTPGKWESGETHCSASPSRLSGGMRSLGQRGSYNFSNPRPQHYSWRRWWYLLCRLFFFSPLGSGQVIKESQMHFKYRLVPAPVKCWQREKETLGTVTHLFLRQILRADLLICQMAKYHYIQDQPVRSSLCTASRTVSKPRCK